MGCSPWDCGVIAPSTAAPAPDTPVTTTPLPDLTGQRSAFRQLSSSQSADSLLCLLAKIILTADH